VELGRGSKPNAKLRMMILHGGGSCPTCGETQNTSQGNLMPRRWEKEVREDPWGFIGAR